MLENIKSKPILFNTAMVQAILDGRKTVTRRVIKPHREAIIENVWLDKEDGEVVVVYNDNNHIGEKGYVKPKYQVGDILWVRETWRVEEARQMARICIIEYKAGGETKLVEEIIALPTTEGRWRPSIHMPKEAARIFLKVTDVRVERLQEIDKFWSSYEKEGMRNKNENISIEMKERFIDVWNSTIKTKNHEEFGWDANPWVFVYEFERCENA